MDDFRALARLSNAQTRSISPENFDGTKGGGGRAVDGTGAAAAAELGQGWKVSPSVEISADGVHDLAVIDEPGVITHIWLTTHRQHWRSLVLRAYWDGADEPAIEVPVGDFFGQGWCTFAQLSSAVVAANPHGGFNSYWPMPFRQSARLTLQNLGPEPAVVYYQITYEIGADQADTGYLHAQFRRSNPLPARTTHPLVSGVAGAGQYVGTYLAWGVNRPGWWGEGEVKFYLDGDVDFPTICGTGTEDYFGGAWNFDVPGQGYTTYSTPYLGLHQVLRLLIPSAISVIILSIGFTIDTSFTSFLTDKASLAALHNAQLFYNLPVALLAQAVAQAALPRMSLLATDGRYLRLRQLTVKVVGAAVLLSIPTAIGLGVLGQPLIRLLFQHGAFNKHSSSLTYLALIGYLVGLTGHVAGDLLSRGFYALKDARTPLFTNVFSLLVRTGLIIFLLKLFVGKSALIAISLAASGAVTAEALLLGYLLYLRLRTKIRQEKNAQIQA